MTVALLERNLAPEVPHRISSDLNDLPDMPALKATLVALADFTERDHILSGRVEVAERAKLVTQENLKAVATLACKQTVEAGDFSDYKPHPPKFYFMTPAEKATIDTNTPQTVDFKAKTQGIGKYLSLANLGTTRMPMAARLRQRQAVLKNLPGDETGPHPDVYFPEEGREILGSRSGDADIWPAFSGAIDPNKDDMSLLDTDDAPPVIIEMRLKQATDNLEVTLPTRQELRVAALALRQYARRVDGPGRVLAINAIEQLSSNRGFLLLQKVSIYLGIPLLRAVSRPDR